LLVVGLATGCIRQPVHECDGPLNISLVWPENQQVPGAKIWLYSSSGLLHLMTECPAGGYQGFVPADTYTVLVVNSDYANATYASRDAVQNSTIQVAARSTDPGTIQQVDRVFCTGAGSVVVQQGDQPTGITLYPKNTVKRLHFLLDASSATAEIVGLDLCMTGIIPSVRVMDGSDAGDTPKRVVVTAEETGGWTYAADMSMFGWRDDNAFTITARYADGTEAITAPLVTTQLQGLPEEGGTVNVTLALSNGDELVVRVTWEGGSGEGTVF
jgi:hypothetical protein